MRRTLVTAVLAATALSAAVADGAGEVGTPGPGTTLAGCPGLPRRQRLEPRHLARAGRPELGYLHALDRRSTDASTPTSRSDAYGIPFRVVPASQKRVPIRFTAYGDESDPGPYPIPLERADRGRLGPPRARAAAAALPPLRAVRRPALGGGAGTPTSGAMFDLRSNALRPDGWTSADAAGLPIFPGLVRYDEVAAGAHHPRAALHGRAAARLHRPRHATRVASDRPRPAADGAAAAAEGELRPVAASTARRAWCSRR